MEKVVLNGYLGGEAKAITINGEEKFYQVSLAPIRRKKERDESDRSLFWYQLNFGLGMKNLMPYLKKGTLVSVIGNIRITAYTDKKSQPAPACVVYVENIELLGRSDGGNASDKSTSAEGAGHTTSDGEELPF